jgi:hypothetical protein
MKDRQDSYRQWLTQVEEVKILVWVLPIWFACVFYSAAMDLLKECHYTAKKFKFMHRLSRILL